VENVDLNSASSYNPVYVPNIHTIRLISHFQAHMGWLVIHKGFQEHDRSRLSGNY